MMPDVQSMNDLSTRERVPHILVVDDEAPNRMLLQRILIAKEYEVGNVASGEDALYMLGHESFDLVLLDIMMPDLTTVHI
jgi:CheY-like chemotaxis protein